MGVYARKESRYWWALIEGTGQRISTKVPIGAKHQRADSRREAEDIYQAVMGDLARGRFKLPTERQAITFRAHADWYWRHVACHHKGKRRARSIIRQLVKHFGDTPLHAIDADRIEEWKTARAQQVQTQSVNRELDLLKPMLAKAVPKYLEVSPADKVKRFPTRRFTPITVLSDSAERALLDAATPTERAFVLLGLDALLRLSDVRTLKVERNHGAYLEIEDPKTGVPYKVPASQRLQKALAALPSLGGGFYFGKQRTRAARDGGKPKEWRPLSEAEAFELFKALCERAGVTRGRKQGGVTFHSLRHTGASRASRVVKPTAVMRLGGWQSMRQLARYDHPDDADMIRAVEAIGSQQPHRRSQKREKPPNKAASLRSSWRGRRDIRRTQKRLI